MQKLKERGSNAVPPKKSASAYILFGKEVKIKNIRVWDAANPHHYNGADLTLYRNVRRS